MQQVVKAGSKTKPNMLKTLLIIPSSTSQKIYVSIILILFSYLLFSYYSFALIFQVHIDIQRNKNLIDMHRFCCRYIVQSLVIQVKCMVNESHPN